MLDRLLKNYYNSRRSWEAWCYLNNIDVQKPNFELRNYCDNNFLLQHVRFLLLKDIHIELYKIIKKGKNTIDSIFTLLNENDSVLANTHLKKIEDHNLLIKNITDTRDKFYAHLDKDYNDYLSNVHVNDYYTIFELIEEAIIILGFEKELNEILDTIPSRDELIINITV